MASPEKRRFVGLYEEQNGRSDIQKTSVKVRILEAVSRRKYSDGSLYGVTNSVVDTSNYREITPVFVSKEHVDKIHDGDFTLVRCSILSKGAIKITPDTIVLETIISDIDEVAVQRIESFIMPPFLSNIAEVFGKQNGERISIKGQVGRVSKVLESEISKRRIVLVGDKTGEIEVKLWGDLSTRDIAVNSSMEFRALGVSLYQDSRSLNSTMSTTVMHAAVDEPFSGDISAACFDRDNSSIYVDEELLQISLEQLLVVYPSVSFTGKKMVHGYKKDSCVSFIEVVAGDDEDDIDGENFGDDQEDSALEDDGRNL